MKDETKELTLATPIDKLENQILEETNVDDLNTMIDLFNLHIKKKDILRANKLSQLQDKISDQIAERIDYKADEFSNKDLIDYFKVIQDTLSKTDTTLDNVKIPAIQVNNQYNISTELDKDSRDRVKMTVDSILNKIKNNQQQEEIVEEVPIEEVISIDDVTIDIVSENDENESV